MYAIRSYYACPPPNQNLIPIYKHINYIHNIYSSEESSQNEIKEMNMNENQKKVFQKPSIEHIQIYFEQKGYPKIEGDRFFNYYESVGWLVGGKTKMKDWKAAARNWIRITSYNVCYTKLLRSTCM